MATRDIFWFLIGLLAMAAIALAVMPWLRQSSSVANALRSLPRWAYAVIPLSLAAALGTYLTLGTPSAAVDTDGGAAAPVTAAAAPTGDAPAGGAMAMDSAVTKLEARLAKAGGADADWELLARSYEFLNRPADAALARQHRLAAGAGSSPVPSSSAPVAMALSPEAQRIAEQADAARGRKEFATATALYAQLVKQKQMNADTWADYADAQASQDRGLQGAAVSEYIANALRLNPDHAKALWLKGSLEEERAQYGAAATTLQHLLAQLPAGSDNARLIAAKVQEDQRLAGGGVTAGGAFAAGRAAVSGGSGAAPAAGVTVSGEVLLADSLRAKVKPGMTLYIVAKAVGVAGAPVAVYRTTTSGWPLRFELSDANAMLPGRNLSSAAKVVVEARISMSGLANSQPGDLLGSSEPLAPAGSRPLRIVIQKVVG